MSKIDLTDWMVQSEGERDMVSNDISDTSRIAVPGGWLYRERYAVEWNAGASVSVALAFVPDPNAPHVKNGGVK